MTPWQNDNELLMVRRLLFGDRDHGYGVGCASKDQYSHAIKLVGAISLTSKQHRLACSALSFENA